MAAFEAKSKMNPGVTRRQTFLATRRRSGSHGSNLVEMIAFFCHNQSSFKFLILILNYCLCLSLLDERPFLQAKHFSLPYTHHAHQEP